MTPPHFKHGTNTKRRGVRCYGDGNPTSEVGFEAEDTTEVTVCPGQECHHPVQGDLDLSTPAAAEGAATTGIRLVDSRVEHVHEGSPSVHERRDGLELARQGAQCLERNYVP